MDGGGEGGATRDGSLHFPVTSGIFHRGRVNDCSETQTNSRMSRKRKRQTSVSKPSLGGEGEGRGGLWERENKRAG